MMVRIARYWYGRFERKVAEITEREASGKKETPKQLEDLKLYSAQAIHASRVAAPYFHPTMQATKADVRISGEVTLVDLIRAAGPQIGEGVNPREPITIEAIPELTQAQVDYQNGDTDEVPGE